MYRSGSAAGGGKGGGRVKWRFVFGLKEFGFSVPHSSPDRVAEVQHDRGGGGVRVLSWVSLLGLLPVYQNQRR